MTHLYRIRKSFYFRIRIPSDLRVWFGGREDFKRSLHTTDPKNAQRLVRAWGCHAERTFTLIRSGFMTKDQIKELVDQFFTQTLEELEDDRAKGVRTVCPRNEDELDVYLDGLAIGSSELREALAFNDLKKVRHLADALLEEKGLSLNSGGTEYTVLCREIMKRAIHINEIEQRRAVGDYSALPQTHPDPRASSSAAALPQAVVDSPMLSKVISQYLKDSQSKAKASSNSRKEYEGIFATMLEVVKDRPVRCLTIDAMLRYQDTMMKLPVHFRTKKEYRGKSLEEILSMEVEQTLSPSTLDKAFTMVKSLFTWMVKRGIVEKNIADVLEAPQQKKLARELRDPFDKEDLKKLVEGLHEAGLKGTLKGKPERFWIPLVALFSGMRLNEICQLHTEDVREDQETGIWYFRVEPDDIGGKRVKNKASIRSIPIHAELIRLGFLDYYKSVVESGTPRLWMNLTKGKNGYGRCFQDWFLGTTRYPGGFLRAHVSTGKGKKDFHSFRHTFRNELKQKLVDATVANELLGHAQGSIGLDRYGKAYHLKVLNDALLQVRYDVDFSVFKDVAA